MRRWQGVVAVAAALGIFALMWVGYLAQWPVLVAVDDAALKSTYGVGAAHPAWVTTLDVFCTVFGPFVFRIVGAVVMVVAVSRRNFRAAVTVLLTVELSGVVTQTAKWLADRARPDSAFVGAFGTSFPSGHALAVAAVAVTVVALAGSRRSALVGAAVTVVVAVGCARVALNVHHPSDVVAGWALGFAYAMACVLLLRPAPLAVTEAETPAVPGTAR